MHQSKPRSVNGCGPGSAGQEKLNHSFLCLRAHVNDISWMTASLVISLRVGERGRRGKRQRERVKHCLQQLVVVCVWVRVCVCVFVGNSLLLLLTKHAESEK